MSKLEINHGCGTVISNSEEDKQSNNTEKMVSVLGLEMTEMERKFIELISIYPEDIQQELKNYIQDYATHPDKRASPLNEIRVILCELNGSLSETTQEIVNIFEEEFMGENAEKMHNLLKCWNKYIEIKLNRSVH